MKRIDAFLKKHKDSNKPYVVHRGKQFSYLDTNQISQNAASFLHNLQVKRENIGIFASNSAEYIFAYFANVFSESTSIPINVKLTDPEIVAELKYCDCNWVLVQAQYVKRLLNISDSLRVGIIELNEYGSMKLVRQTGTCVNRENKMDVAVMLHTSGTTGNPKKVMLSHRNLYANTLSNIESLKLTNDDIVLIALPLFFGYCHTAQFLTHTRLGGTIILYDEPIFSAKHFCALVERYRVTCFTGVPTMLAMIDNYPYIDKYDLSSLRYICFGGGSVSLEMVRRLMKKIPNTGLVQTYGQTECSPRVTALLPEDSLEKIGSVGRAIPGVTVEIVNESDDVVCPGQVGEIRVRGENTTPGYYKNQEENRKILKNGWLYTGDFAKYDTDGYIYLVGRKKNMIISGGVNLYPEDIETVIKCHPSVEDVLVKSHKDDLLGEVPVAYVILKDCMDITIEGLHSFLDKKLAQYKWPKYLFVVDNFEKTSTGKTKRQWASFSPNEETAMLDVKCSLTDQPPDTKTSRRSMLEKEYDLVVSLGTTCQTAYQLRRLNLRQCAGPLDWFIIPFDSLLILLQNKFEHFMARKNLAVIGEYQGENSVVEDTMYNVKSYHDFSLAALNGNVWNLYPSFKEKIDRRVKRLLEQLDTLDEILFVINAGNVSASEYVRLIDVLSSLRHGKNFHVLATGYCVPRQTYEHIENISFARFTKLPMPKRNPTWLRGCDEEWNNCIGSIKLKKQSQIG
jgi:long-chain acyl-CoA synthetase